MNLKRLYTLIKQGFFDYLEHKGCYPDTVYLRPEHYDLLPESETPMFIGLKLYKSQYVPENEMIFAEMSKCFLDLEPIFEFDNETIIVLKYISLPPFNIYKI